jgi:hypothetical protein
MALDGIERLVPGDLLVEERAVEVGAARALEVAQIRLLLGESSPERR